MSVTRSMAASPDAVYALVSDVTRIGEWSPETTSCRWLGGASGAAVGARFAGSNRHGWRRWTTVCTVTAADPGRRFAFDVAFGPVPVATWAYAIAPDGGTACTVTESWLDRRPAWMRMASKPVMGVRDRATHNRAGMAHTLEALSRTAERG